MQTVLVATDRAAVAVFFRTLPSGPGCDRRIARMRLSLGALDEHLPDLDRATVAVVDVGTGAAAGVAVCAELRRRRRELPVAALVCCPGALSPWALRDVLSQDVSVLDLEASPHEVARALDDVARGGSVVRLHLARGQRAGLRDLLAAREPRAASDLRMVELVALELTDQEIGRELYLSQHTVNHHIAQLRGELGVRNRTELAA